MDKRIKIDVEVRCKAGLTVEVDEDIYNGLNGNIYKLCENEEFMTINLKNYEVQ